ncbi:sensor histidine kinase [Agromyces sp. NPDC056379]|uniref:sensor histidine kinase n=1 Tax=unclassified Agromyces TaxID=2639701 RepID=UPI0035DC036B
MDLNLSRPSWQLLLAPAAGAAYIVLWWIAEAGRLGNAPLGAAVAVVPIIAFGVALAISQRWPAVALAVIAAVLSLQLLMESARFGDTSWPAYVPLLYAVFNVSAFGRPPVHRLALPIGAIGAVAVALLLTLPLFGQQGWPVFYSVESEGLRSSADIDPSSTVMAACIVAVGLAVGAWCAGLAMRAVRRAYDERLRAQELERELHAAEAELVELSERDRLAQDVHDVMAHSLAVIAAQADGTRMTDRTLAPGTNDALATIAEVARDGLRELRQLLDAAPLDEGIEAVDLAALFERVRAAGHECEFVVFGEAKPLTSAQQLSVYRIMQEALTNALKHAGTTGATRAALDWRGPGLAILIATAPSMTEPTAPGRGIRGMQERARLAGGWLTASADESGAFMINAFIPTSEISTEDVVTAEAMA